LAEALAALGANLSERIRGKDVAKDLNLSYDVFPHRFVREMGVSPARFRLNQRIAASCDLLRHSSLNIRQISELLGFNTEFHFSQRFKGIKGESPSRFRAREKEFSR
jgi:transcriptional regulator GlxA family with amidase domain